MTRKRLAILTGGGDCPGLNAVIRAAVRTATHDYDYDVLGIQLGFEGLLTGSTIPLTAASIRGILPKGGTLLRTTNRGNPFEYPTEGGGSEDRSSVVLDAIEQLGIDGVIAIGGDGTLKIAQRLCDMGVPMVAVPKTIDNDLAATDYTFGFMTAVAVATEAIDLEIRVTVLGHVQRGGSPIAFDRILASRFGKAAADLVARGEFGKMVSLRGDEIVAVPIRDAVSNPKSVDPDGEVVSAARSLGISFGDGR
jgi:6-phosphofructokinase